MNWETIMCFGDSITIGARSYCAYPDYCGNRLEKSTGVRWHVVNHAVSGYTTMDLARYMTAHFSNLRQFFPGIITVLIGTNDVKRGTSEKDFEIAYRQVILKALLLSVQENVVLILLPNFPQNIAYPYRYNMNVTIDAYNEIVKKLAKEFRLRTHVFELNESDLFDGVHLNTKGSETAGTQLAAMISEDKGTGQASATTELKIVNE